MSQSTDNQLLELRNQLTKERKQNILLKNDNAELLEQISVYQSLSNSQQEQFIA